MNCRIGKRNLQLTFNFKKYHVEFSLPREGPDSYRDRTDYLFFFLIKKDRQYIGL